MNRAGQIVAGLAGVAFKDPHPGSGLFGRRDKIATGLGQIVAIPVRPEQLHLQRLFKCLDPARDRGGADAKGLGRRGKRLPLRQRQKEFQVVPVHDALHFRKAYRRKQASRAGSQGVFSGKAEEIRT